MSNEQEVPVNRKEIPLEDVKSPAVKAHMSSRPQFPDPAKSIKKEDIKSNDDVIDFLLNKSTDEILPWEDCVLPSKGVYYDGRIPDGKVRVKPMGITADKIFATARLTQTGQAIEYIYKNHIQFPDKDFEPGNLLVGDRVYLLFYLRAITHGNIYEFIVKCTNEDCGMHNTYESDLNDIEANKRGPKHSAEPVKITLPHLSEVAGREVWAECRFLRGRDMAAIAKQQQFKKRITSGKAVNKIQEQIILDQSIEDNLDIAIVSINGKTDRNVISGIIKRMSQRDTQKIRSFLNEESPGIDTSITVRCTSCDNEMSMDLPITETFFRPKNSGGM